MATVSYKRFDGDWVLETSEKTNGAMTASVDRIAAASILLIRDTLRSVLAEAREQTKILRRMDRRQQRKK